jgi:hypothetical protein
MHLKMNWKTAYKLHRYCVICGLERDIQMQHIKHAKKVKLQFINLQEV